MRIGLSIVRKRRMKGEVIRILRLDFLKAENMKTNTKNQNVLIETNPDPEVADVIRIIDEGEVVEVI